MTFADDYTDYQLWKQSLDDSPQAWERQRDLEADAEFYRENKADITEALDMLYQARSWWGEPTNYADPKNVGAWFTRVFADQLSEWCFPELDDDLPF